MSEFINPITHDRPAYCEVGVFEEGKGLILSAHRKFAESLKSLTAVPTRPLFQDFENNLQICPIKPYESDTVAWGFGNVFTPHSTDESWVRWHCEFPESANNLSSDDDWRRRNEFAASMRVLTLLASTFQEHTDSTRNQLADFSIGVPNYSADFFDQAPLSAIFYPTFAKWIRTQEHLKRSPDTEAQMRTTYQRMSRWPVKSSDRFEVSYHGPHYVLFTVPGDRCELNPTRYGALIEKNGEQKVNGYELSGHNVDTLMQQMTFMTAIAALHDKARADGF